MGKTLGNADDTSHTKERNSAMVNETLPQGASPQRTRQAWSVLIVSTFAFTLDLRALQATLDATGQQIAEAARPAAQAGAQVLYDEVKRNVSRIKRKTGNLAASIYQVYSKDQSRPNGLQTYHIGWNNSNVMAQGG